MPIFTRNFGHNRTLFVLPTKECKRFIAISNEEAINCLKSHEEKLISVQEVFNIYNNINEPKHVLLINSVLRHLTGAKEIDHIVTIWHDIERISINQKNQLAFESLITCCASSRNVNIYQCTQVLQWMQSYDCKTSATLIALANISRFISKCRHKEHKASLECIHSWIEDNTTEINTTNRVHIDTALIAAYGRCQEVHKALNIFNHQTCTNMNYIRMINAIMKTCIDNKHCQQALNIYHKFSDLIVKDSVSNFLALKACKQLKYVKKGKQIISDTYASADKENINIRFKALLIEFYGDNGDITDAEEVFHSISNTQMDSFCVASMMKQFVMNGLFKAALDLYDRYEAKQNAVGYLFAIKACSNMGDVAKGIQIHNKIKVNPSVYDLKIKHALIPFYGKYKKIDEALDVFESIDIKHKNIITYNTMMQAYVNSRLCHKALHLYDTLTTKDVFSHCAALKACIYTKNKDRGKEIHRQIQSKLERHQNDTQTIELMSSLIDFYSCFDINDAWKIFMSLSDEHKNGRFVAAMMKACIDNEDNPSALELYQRFTALQNNRVIQMLGIKACCNLGDIKTGKNIHSNCNIGNKNTQFDVDLKHTLIHLYGNAMDLESVLSIFHSIDNVKKSVITINAMMNAYCVSTLNKECIELFENIANINILIKPDIVSYKILVTAITFVASIDRAINIYNELKVYHKQMLNDRELCIKLINMNSKYGLLSNCIEIFEWFEHKNIDMWNAMIRTYCDNNDFNHGYKTYEKLKYLESVNVNKSTYIILLNACSHYGDVYKAYDIWQNEINSQSKLKFNIAVINTMVDCFARSGYLYKAYEFIVQFEKQTKKKNDVIWNTLMSGCAKYNDRLLATYVYNEMQKRFKTQSNSMTGAKVSLSNITKT